MRGGGRFGGKLPAHPCPSSLSSTCSSFVPRPCWSQGEDVNKRKPHRARAWSRALIPSTDDLVIISRVGRRRRVRAQLHKRINERTRIKDGPERTRGCRRAQNATVCVAAVYFYHAVRPGFGELLFASNHIPSLFSGWMKSGNVTMAITIFGFCLHAVMRQAFPSPSADYPGHAPHHGHVDIQYTVNVLNV